MYNVFTSQILFCVFFFFFFFQAEDGIRDLIVTGVQTCALPIYGAPIIMVSKASPFTDYGKLRNHNYGGSIGGPILRDKAFFFFTFEAQRFIEIGRASCRERV